MSYVHETEFLNHFCFFVWLNLGSFCLFLLSKIVLWSNWGDGQEALSRRLLWYLSRYQIPDTHRYPHWVPQFLETNATKKLTIAPSMNHSFCYFIFCPSKSYRLLCKLCKCAGNAMWQKLYNYWHRERGEIIQELYNSLKWCSYIIHSVNCEVELRFRVQN